MRGLGADGVLLIRGLNGRTALLITVQILSKYANPRSTHCGGDFYEIGATDAIISSMLISDGAPV